MTDSIPASRSPEDPPTPDAPLHLVYGAESALCEQWISTMRRNWQTTIGTESTTSAIDLQEQSLSEAIDEMTTPSFFAQQKLLIIKNAFFLTTLKNRATEAELSAFEAYVHAPIPEHTVLLYAPVAKLDERKKIVKLLKKTAQEHAFAPLQGQQLVRWIIDTAREYDAVMAHQEAQSLVDIAGNTCGILRKEIEKLAIYVGKGQPITKKAINEVVVPALEHHVFAFVDAVVERRIAVALRMLHDLYTLKEEPIKLLLLLARQFRQLLERKLEEIVPSTTKLPPFIVKKQKQQASRYTMEQLRTSFDQLASLDYAMKSGLINPQQGLELWVLSLHEQRSPPTPSTKNIRPDSKK